VTATGRLKRAVFIVSTVIVTTAVAAEALLRIRNPIQSRVRGDRIVLVANRSYTIRNTTVPRLPPTIAVRLNSLGFRGPEPPARFADSLTVVAIGGSTTQSFFISDGLTWPDRLAARLTRSFPATWVNNAGLDGHSTFGHLVLLDDYIVPLHPKVALFLVGLNDVDRTDLSAYERETVRSGWSFRSPASLAKSLAAYSELASTIINLVRSFEAYQRGLAHRPIDVRQRELLTVDEPALDRYVQRFVNDALAGYERRVNAIVDRTRGAGIEPVLITQPMLLGSGVDDMTGVDLARVRANAATQSGAMYWRPLELYNDVVRRTGAARGVLVVDLAHQLPKSSRFFYDFTHFTVEGSDRVAAIVAAALCPVLQQRFPSAAAAPCPAEGVAAPPSASDGTAPPATSATAARARSTAARAP
jgi:lysophospholipase L1-like esterase